MLGSHVNQKLQLFLHSRDDSSVARVGGWKKYGDSEVGRLFVRLLIASYRLVTESLSSRGGRGMCFQSDSGFGGEEEPVRGR